MVSRFNPLDYPACLSPPDWAVDSLWAEYAPFVHSLVEVVRPRVAVGLGDHGGRYGPVSDSSPGAARQFADGTIDLLLLDGPDDFGPWLPKMSDRGVLLLHGRGSHFAGLRDRYRSFEFTHGRGLTAFAVGTQCPPAFDTLLTEGEAEATYIREFYYQLGARINQEKEGRRLRASRRDLLERLAEAEQLAQVYRLQGEERDDQLRRATAELEPIRRSLALRVVRLLARLEWAMAPAGSRRRNLLHLARHGVGALRRRAAFPIRKREAVGAAPVREGGDG